MTIKETKKVQFMEGYLTIIKETICVIGRENNSLKACESQVPKVISELFKKQKPV